MVQFTTVPKTAKDDEESIKTENASVSASERPPNGGPKPTGGAEEEGSRKRKRRRDKGSKNGGNGKRRRHSISKAARDPRDEASPADSPADEEAIRSPSPVIDFDGLSHPSMYSGGPLPSQRFA